MRNSYMSVNVNIPSCYYEKGFLELCAVADSLCRCISDDVFDNEKINGYNDVSEEMVNCFIESIIICSFLSDGNFSEKEYRMFIALKPEYDFSYEEAKEYCFEVIGELSGALESFYTMIIEFHLIDIAVLITKLVICCIVIDGAENYSEHDFFSFFAAGIKSHVII